MPRDSDKLPVFRVLFSRRYDASTGHMDSLPVTNAELQDAISLLNQEGTTGLSLSNPANFLKDFLRSARRNQQWPAEIAAARYTARQAYGAGRVFEFVPYSEGQVEPFPNHFDLPSSAPLHQIESVSLPSIARALGRSDEAWLIQVCVHQRVLQTHFALYSPLQVIDLYHLQNSLKGTPEIDAVFLAVIQRNGQPAKALLTLEAKRNEPILPDQLRSQISTMADQTRRREELADIEFIIPVAARSFARDGKRVIGVFEMNMVPVAEGAAAFDQGTAHSLPLELTATMGYILKPSVSGV